MDGIRLNKVAKELNVGIPTTVEFLAKEGYEVEANPNTRIDKVLYERIVDAFKSNQETEEVAPRFTTRILREAYSSPVDIDKLDIAKIDISVLEERIKSKK